MAEKEETKQVKNQISQKEIEEGKVCAILAYIFWIVGILWYFMDEKMKKNEFAKFHVKQGIMLVIASTIFTFAVMILFFILMITIIGMLLVIPLMLLFFLPTVWTIIGIVYAVKGERKPLPWIGEYAEKWFNF